MTEKTEQELKQAILKGERAARLTEAHADAWADLEADITAMWRRSKVDDRELRESCWHELHACSAIRARIKRVVREGEKAAHELEQRRQHAAAVDQLEVRRRGNRNRA